MLCEEGMSERRSVCGHDGYPEMAQILGPKPRPSNWKFNQVVSSVVSVKQSKLILETFQALKLLLGVGAKNGESV